MPKEVKRKMPPPLPKGEVLTDAIKKQQWAIGSSIGKGGFGEIYLASFKNGGTISATAKHVIKIEPHENGPLFSELSYYRRAAKEELIKAWIDQKNLKYLGIPKYITCGSHEFKGNKYRFMVMERFGDNVEKHFKAAGRSFCHDTICYLALRILEGLEYLHESEYVHADIKGSNLLIDLVRPERVYLVDYGLAYRYAPEGSHKEYKADPRKAHDGTIEFTSIDAHDGASPSRRGDLEILGYCLLQWGCGKLPWEDKLSDKVYVGNKKRTYKGHARQLIQDCFGDMGPNYLQKYMEEVYKLGYTEKPPYSKLQKVFQDQLHGRDPVKTLEWVTSTKIKAPSNPPSRRPAASSMFKPSPDAPEATDCPPKSHVATATAGKKRRAESRPKLAPPAVKKRLVGSPSNNASPAAVEKNGGSKLGKRTSRDDIIPGVVYPQELGYNDVGLGSSRKERKVEKVPHTSSKSSKNSKGKGASSSTEAPVALRRSTRAVKRVNYRESFGSNAGDSSIDQSDSSFTITLDDSFETVQPERQGHKKRRI